MKASISFDFKEMKEHIKFGKKDINSNICSTFLDILSIDTDYINNEIIRKIDFSNPDDIKNAYKKVYKIQPLLFIDEFNFIKHLNDFKNPQKTILDFDNSIFQLSTFINDQKKIDADSSIINEFTNNLKFLKQKRKNYIKITNDFSKYINANFLIILNHIKLYKTMIDVCYIDNSDVLFKGFSELTPLKKAIFYAKFKFKESKFFDNLPTNNIKFKFDFASDELRKKFIDSAKSNPDKALKLLFDEKISFSHEYDCKTFEQFLQICFFTCLVQNLNIKKCQNCKKYFIAYQRSDEKYCSRISPQDKNKTCKQYANFENWKININSNEELKMYRRIYMAKQMQTRRNPNDLKLKKSFDNWKKEAQSIRNEYVHGKINKKDFLSWLNTNS